MSTNIRIGTRASALARWQAEFVADRLRSLGADVELVPISTSGDRDRNTSVARLGGRGAFTREIQQALLQGRIDLAVHSLKDLPTEPVAGLVLAAVPERASPADALVSVRCVSLDELLAGAVVGTGSLRRRAQLLRLRTDLQVRDIRGNVDTRLRKLDQGQYDAVILAQAGLERLGLGDRIRQVLPLDALLPAAGQGALGLETRADDRRIIDFLHGLDHPPTHAAVMAERALLSALQAGCLAPVACWGRIEGDELLLTGRVVCPDGRELLEHSLAAPPNQARDLGIELGKILRSQGADRLIRLARAESTRQRPPADEV